MDPAVCRLLISVLLLNLATCAPQDATSITYVKSLSQPRETQGPRLVRDSRIENLPLVIGPGEVSEEPVETSDQEFSTVSNPRYTRDETTANSEPETPATASNEAAEVNKPTEPSQPNEPFKPIESIEPIEPIESTEPKESVKPKEVKFPSPRFVSKLSYFHKSSDFSSVTNLVERTGKRKFRSRCRCEKISNCPKLQITVPRCPEEYFMCCF